MYISEITQGRPNTEGLLARECATYDYLDALGIPYRRVGHDAAETMEACAEIDTRLGVKMCKNLFLKNVNHSFVARFGTGLHTCFCCNVFLDQL